MFHKPNFRAGVGINYRPKIENDILTYLNEIDFLEINTERFFHSGQSEHLKKFISEKPIVLHGLSLSIGNSDNIKDTYLANLKRALDTVDHLWFSEHIALTKERDVELRGLMPVAFTDENVERIAKRAKMIDGSSNSPFILENITYYYPIPGSTLTEFEFISRIVNESDCGMLLDVNNLFINAYNHKYDPYEFLKKLPLDRVVEIHLAGGNFIDNMLIDTHASSIRKEVYQLFEHVCKICSFNGVIIERDAKLTRFLDLVEEIHIVKNIMRKTGIYVPDSLCA